MSEWIMCVVGVVVLSVLLDILLPQGQTSKYIKGVFGILTILVIVSPLPKLINNLDFEKLFDVSAVFEIDEAYVASVGEAKKTEKEQSVADMLSELGYEGAYAKIVEKDGFSGEIDHINIFVPTLDITGENVNIDIANIKSATSKHLLIEEWEVRVFGAY